MARDLGNDFTQVEDWFDVESLCMDPMTEVETRLWSAIVAKQRSGDIETMLHLVALFEAIQHGDLDTHGRVHDHTRAMLYDVVNDALRPENERHCVLSHFGLAL